MLTPKKNDNYFLKVVTYSYKDTKTMSNTFNCLKEEKLHFIVLYLRYWWNWFEFDGKTHTRSVGSVECLLAPITPGYNLI